jgi:hypothetical protein
MLNRPNPQLRRPRLMSRKTTPKMQSLRHQRLSLTLNQW